MVDISIWITAYNHEEYIAEALESVLGQLTTFTYELVIGEDFSSDRTREIVLAYKARYPDRIRLYLPDKNLGMIPMTKASYDLCTGRYIAWLDGDDYWIDPYKLQKQVEFLETNPEFSFCFHKVRIIDRIKDTFVDSVDPVHKGIDNTFSTEHFLQVYNPVYTSSVLHRNVVGHPLPEWLLSLPFTDWGFYLILCKYGKGKYFSETMSIYRVHQRGAYSGQTDYNQILQIISFFKLIRNAEFSQYNKYTKKVIQYYRYRLYEIDLKNRDFVNAIKNRLFSRFCI
ncbi:glycosyl transferase [Hymenobacter qilianensis]|uniref:Glycosyl transferase n=2 Tax=Hymenobacter qilianensis TaxID=1385715 RepID=A0ACB5PNR2_9BACT|nr:glycosyltransferase [Hymenobacter qilianensis]QNP53440.1 glycosyltransferase [Hymenobacter qilianensis]GGF56506.1 glycosyl transferase [Hymenobacter qilianensis]